MVEGVAGDEELRFERILLAALPGDAGLAAAWAWAIDLARRAGASVRALGVVREPSSELAEAAHLASPQLERIAADELRETLARLAGAGAVAVEVVSGLPFIEIIRAVLRDRYDLVISSADASSAVAGPWGSTVQHLLRKCPVPVWAVRSTSRPPPARIAVAVDADPEAERRALDRKLVAAGARLAELYGSELHVLHAFAPLPSPDMLRHRAGLAESVVVRVLGGMRERRRQRLEALLAGSRLPASRCVLRIVDGDPKDEIPRQVTRESIDLLILGSVGRTGVTGLLMGNTAEEILRRVEGSVLVLKPEGFESPVKL